MDLGLIPQQFHWGPGPRQSRRLVWNDILQILGRVLCLIVVNVCKCCLYMEYCCILLRVASINVSSTCLYCIMHKVLKKKKVLDIHSRHGVQNKSHVIMFVKKLRLQICSTEFSWKTCLQLISWNNPCLGLVFNCLIHVYWLNQLQEHDLSHITAQQSHHVWRAPRKTQVTSRRWSHITDIRFWKNQQSYERSILLRLRKPCFIWKAPMKMRLQHEDAT